MGLITHFLDNVRHTPSDYADHPASIVGRPLAFVTTGWSPQLAMPPMENQCAVSNTGDPPINSLSSVLDYEFALKIGDCNNIQDGVVGIFAENVNSTASKRIGLNVQDKDQDGSPFDFGYIHTQFGSQSAESPPSNPPNASALYQTSKLPQLRPFFVDPAERSPQEFEVMLHSQFKVFATLIDPFCTINGFTGILPPIQLQLPPWTVSDALRQIRPFFRVGPTLVPGDLPDTWKSRVASLSQPFEEIFDQQAVSEKSRAATKVPSSSNVNGAASPKTTKGQIEQAYDPSIPVHTPVGGDWIWLQPQVQDNDLHYFEIDVRNPMTDYRPVGGPHTAIEDVLQRR